MDANMQTMESKGCAACIASHATVNILCRWHWKFVDQSNKCVEKVGDYVKKLQYFCSCVPFVEWRK